MITVTVSPSGDWAEAETPEDAITCARTLLREAREAGAGDPRASFEVARATVRSGLKPADLSSA
jgi:hypothetical protein